MLAFRAGFRRREPNRFDVVRLEDPRSPGHWIMKRIIGLPGEDIELRSGELFVDGEAVDVHGGSALRRRGRGGAARRV